MAIRCPIVVITTLVLVGLLDTSSTQQLAAAVAQTSDEIKAHIAQLGSPKYAVREAAAKALDALGNKALPALRDAANNRADAEVKNRAAQLVTSIEQRLTDYHTFRAHESCIYKVAFADNGRQIMSAAYDNLRAGSGMLRVWDAKDHHEIRQFAGKGIVYDFALTTDGRRLATGAGGGDFCLWDFHTGTTIRRFPTSSLPVMALGISSDNRWLISGSSDGKRGILQIWDVESGAEVRTLADWQSPIYTVSFLPDGQSAISAGKDGVIRIWDVNAGREIRSLAGHTNVITHVAISPDGQRALSSSWDHTIRLWDLKSGRELRRFVMHSNSVRAVKFTNDGRRALSASHDGTVRLWDIESGQEVRRFEKAGVEFADAAISPDGKSIAAGSMNGMLHIWRLFD